MRYTKLRAEVSSALDCNNWLEKVLATMSDAKLARELVLEVRRTLTATQQSVINTMIDVFLQYDKDNSE